MSEMRHVRCLDYELWFDVGASLTSGLHDGTINTDPVWVPQNLREEFGNVWFI